MTSSAERALHGISLSPRLLFERYGIYIFLVLLVIIASIISPEFFNPQNLKDILNQSAALGIVALGQTFVILIGGGGLDLSVGSVMATVAVIMAHNTEGENALFFPVLGVCVLFGVSRNRRRGANTRIHTLPDHNAHHCLVRPAKDHLRT